MTITSYSYIGTSLIGLGIALGIASVVLFVVAGSGISMGSPEGVDSDGTLHFHDTYFILFSLGHRLTLLLPLVAALILIVCGLLIRWQIPPITEVMNNIEAEQAGHGDAEPATR
jgi:hypothetical protein